jgi:hypothetical protein
VVNAKRVWRVMHENNLLVMKKAQPAADARQHRGRVVVVEITTGGTRMGLSSVVTTVKN